MRRAHCDRSLETVQGLQKWRGWYRRAACCGVKLGAKRPPRYRVYTQRRYNGQTCRVFMYSDQFLFLLCCSAVDSTITVCSSTMAVIRAFSHLLQSFIDCAGAGATATRGARAHCVIC
jgi:hypothetical protein